MPVDLDRDAFELLVDEALDTIPEQVAALADNVVVLVEDEPPEGEPRDLLGLYDGVALTDRGTEYGGVLPDRIFVFRLPLLAMCDDFEELADEVRITVVHEVAHHFGIDDAALHELGYG